MSDLHDASSVIAVNITDIIARLRDKARTAGIDLSQPFFFPPEHERFSQVSNKVTRCLEWLAQAQAGQLVEKVLDQALVGDVACQRMMLEKVRAQRRGANRKEQEHEFIFS